MSIIQKILYTVLIMIIFLVGLNFYTPQVTYIIASYYFKDINWQIEVIGLKDLAISQYPSKQPIVGGKDVIYIKGETISHILVATNNGTEPMNINVKTDGEITWGEVYFEPTNLGLLKPGKSANTTISIKIPLDIVSGNYTFRIRFYES